MRIDYIEFKNFASYGNQKQRIEFKEDTSELFLTLGKNGDGKTTIATLLFKLSLLESFIPIVVVLILTAPFSLRFSRIIWINIFVHFDKNIIKIEQ